MDQRELESRIKALTKCVAANEPAENAIKLLESLKKDCSPTEEMLRVRLTVPRDLTSTLSPVVLEHDGCS
jgi:hypothetical protein